MTSNNYILPIYFKGAPNPSVMICLKIRVVTNENHKHFGMCSIYSDSNYNPLNEAVATISENGYITRSQAEKILKDLGCIQVKDGFDQYSIEDLREIKEQLPAEWVAGYDERG